MTGERLGYDSTSAADCPHNGKVYGGYISGSYATNYLEQKKLHPDALVFRIGRFVGDHADFYDVEGGLLTPTQGVTAAKGNLDRGEFAGIYCNASTWPKVRTLLVNSKILDKVKIWVAWEHEGDNEIPDYAVGRQYLLEPGMSPGHYDVSNWRAHVPGLDPPLPKPKPDPKPKPAKTYPLSALSRQYTRRLTRRLEARTHPVNPAGKTLLRALIAAAEKAVKL